MQRHLGQGGHSEVYAKDILKLNDAVARPVPPASSVAAFRQVHQLPTPLNAHGTRTAWHAHNMART